MRRKRDTWKDRKDTDREGEEEREEIGRELDMNIASFYMFCVIEQLI